jgi:hypothetical protein
MKFTIAVQNQEIAWPTQRNFNKKTWLEKTKELAEDQRDYELSEVGIWTADTLSQIHEAVKNSDVWRLPFRYFAQAVLAMSNRDFKLGKDKSEEITSNSSVTYADFMDERILQAFAEEQQFFGAETISAHLESGLDAADLSLSFHRGSDEKYFNFPKKLLTDLWQVQNFGVLYLAARECFFRALFFGWSISKRDDIWLVMPKDKEFEARWFASNRRFSGLLSQSFLIIFDRWKKSPGLRQMWFERTGGVPEFVLRYSNNFVRVEFKGKQKSIPLTLPTDIIYQTIANEYYYEPLLQMPLSKLNGLNVLDLLRVQFLLETIVSKMLERYPKEGKKITPEILERFCPIIHQDPLTSAIAAAMGLTQKEVSNVIDALTWVKGKNSSLWFHPLLPFTIDKRTGLLGATLPIVAGNIYRSIDYWLSEFGLPMEKRGQLFEEQIIDEIQTAIKDGNLERKVFIRGPLKLTSSDKSSEEEIDVLILLGDILVVGEAKCQKYPATQLERFNYLNTLRGAALQASRKVEWIRQNLNVVASLFQVKVDSLSGKIIPVVISNHAHGVGMSFDKIPILDLLLIKNYLSHPYQKKFIFTAQGMKEYKEVPFYRNFQELLDKFEAYINTPPFLESYYQTIKPNLIRFPLRKDGDIFMLDFVMDETLLT